MNAKIPFQIVIPRRASICAHGGEVFAKGSEYYSALIEGAAEGVYERRDYCIPCATKLLHENALKHVKSLWKSSIPPQKEVSDLPRQREEQALVLLKDMVASNDENAIEEAFVLALYLARRRRLYLRQEMRLDDGAQAALYEVPETEEMLCIRKIPLSHLRVEKVQTSLARKFNTRS